MEIRQLKYFIAVADARSFLKAADTLYVSRQAVSKAITQLEDALGVELFVRNQNGAMMTPAGIHFYTRAAVIVADFEKLQQEMLEFDRTYRPKINIFMSHETYDIFARDLYEYSLHHINEMNLQMNVCMDSQCEELLTERRADMVLTSVPINSRMIDTEKVFESPVKLLVSKESALAKKKVITPSDLADTKYLLYTGGRKKCLWLKREPEGKLHRSNELLHLFSLLKDGQGVMPIAEAAIPGFVDFAERREYPYDTNNWSAFCSMLTSSHYNVYMYNMLDDIYNEVFLKRRGTGRGR